jgi:hypothetical protein
MGTERRGRIHTNNHDVAFRYLQTTEKLPAARRRYENRRLTIRQAIFIPAGEKWSVP